MSKKKKSSRSSRPTILMVLVLILVITNAATAYYFIFMDDSIPASDAPLGFADISGADAPLGEIVTVAGYCIYAAGNYLLVSDPMFFFNNSLDPGNHLVIMGTVPDTLPDSVGHLIAAKGLLQIEDASDGTRGMVCDSFFELTDDTPKAGQYVDIQMNPYNDFEDILPLLDPTADKYAILYSGGIKPEKAYSRYWNDIIYMYFILQMHGYEEENIYVIYKDGVGEDTYTPVHYPATHDSLDTVFDILSDKMGRADSLFFYTTNHGGSGGISVWGPMDSSGALTHGQVSDWLDSITCHHMVIVMEQCVSGKFINYISTSNRVILTACKDDEGSKSCDTEGNWDEFVFHFMCALVSFDWADPFNTVDADFNDDEKISMREAFIWAAISDSREETPWYNDNGDGIGLNVGQVIFQSGPWLGDNIFL